MPETGKRTIKILRWIALSLILLIIAAAGIIWWQAPNYIRKNLSEIVSEESNGLYRISYDDIGVKLSPFTLEIQEFSLQPDKAVAQSIRQHSPEKIIYSFHSTEIEFINIALRSLIFDNRFYCSKLKITSPQLTLSGEDILRPDSAQNVENLFYELRPVFKNHLKEIHIDKIELNDAQYGISQTIGDSAHISKADKISVDILNFRTDSSLIYTGAKLFNTDDVVIRMNDFRHAMGDSLHIVSIDTLAYSLETSEISATGFHLTGLRAENKKNLYDVHVPRFYMKSKSVTNLNFSDSLDIQFLEFVQPQIKFFQKENPERINIKDLNDFDLYSLVQKDLLKIEVDTFLLTDAGMEIYRQPDKEKYQQKFSSVNILLHGFLLDSTSAQNQNKLLHANDLEMAVSDYHLRMEDNQHAFRADSLFVSTLKQSLGAKNIKVLPADEDKIQSRTVVGIVGEAIKFEEVNLKKLYHTRTLPSSKIEILNPEVNLTYHNEVQKSKNQKEAGLLFDMVSAYLKGVYADVVYLENGVLNIENRYNNNVQGYFETSFSFGLNDFSLDSASVQRTDKFFYATDFNLWFSEYEMKLADDLHMLDVDSIFISSNHQRVQINNLHLKPVIQKVTTRAMKRYNRSELYNIFVPQINLQGIKLREAFFHNQLNITNFEISNPKIYFENFGTLRAEQEKKEFSELYQLVFNYVHDFDIKRIAVPNGEMTWVNHTRKGKTTSFDNEFSATLTNFRLNENELNKKRLLFSDNFEIAVKDQIFQLSDSVHILRAGEIQLSTRNSNIRIKDALLYPVIAAENYHDLPTTFQVSIPEIKLSNFDFLSAYYSRNLRFQELVLNEPKIQIYSQPGTFKTLELKKYQFPLPAFIRLLQLNEFRINDGQVLTFETYGINHRVRSNFKIDLSVPGLKLSNNGQKQSELKTDNLILNITDFKSPLGDTHNISIDQISFNRNDKKLAVNNLNVRPFTSDNSGNRFTIDAPGILFTEFDINRALEENFFSFGNINIDNPSIKIAMNDSVREDKIDFLQTLDLYPYTEPYVDRIEVGKLSLNNAAINFNLFRKQLIDRKINLNFEDIVIAENQPPANLLNSKEFQIITTHLKTTDKKGYYEFAADSFIYNSAKHSILFKDLSVTPLIPGDEMPREKGYQTDVINAQIDFVELKGINEKRWLKENVLDADALTIGNSDVSVFRNKRYPFDHSLRPPWPQELIHQISQPFVFDSVKLMPSQLKYSELMTISDKPGFVNFNNLQFKTGKISNIAEVIRQNKNLRINASAEIFDQAKLSTVINFDMTSKNFHHSVSGSLGSMPLTAVNVIAEKSAPLSVESGTINRFEFNMTLDENRSEGSLYFGYDDFKISMLDYSSDEVRKSKFASFWANKMILNSKNPKDDELLPVSISYERDVERSIINFWWKSIYSGAKKVIGIKTDE